MAHIIWFCPLVQPQPGRPLWQPKIEDIRNQATGNFPCVWVTTDAIRANKFACGVADVDAAQLAAIQAAGQIHTIDIDTERFAQFKDLSTARKTAINQFLTQIGIERPTTNEVIEDMVDRIIGSIELKNLGSLLGTLAQEVRKMNESKR